MFKCWKNKVFLFFKKRNPAYVHNLQPEFSCNHCIFLFFVTEKKNFDSVHCFLGLLSCVCERGIGLLTIQCTKIMKSIHEIQMFLFRVHIQVLGYSMAQLWLTLFTYLLVFTVHKLKLLRTKDLQLFSSYRNILVFFKNKKFDGFYVNNNKLKMCLNLKNKKGVFGFSSI